MKKVEKKSVDDLKTALKDICIKVKSSAATYWDILTKESPEEIRVGGTKEPKKTERKFKPSIFDLPIELLDCNGVQVILQAEDNQKTKDRLFRYCNNICEENTADWFVKNGRICHIIFSSSADAEKIRSLWAAKAKR